MVARRRHQVVVLQDYVPEYRRGFFEDLENVLAADGVDLVVAVGALSRHQAERNDSARDSLSLEIPSYGIELRGRRVVFRRSRKLIRDSDLVIAEQGIRNLDVWAALLGQRLGGTRVALWGHGRTYVRPRSPFEWRLLAFLTREAHWFFAYTEGGARAVVELGHPADRITVVQNSNDTVGLARLRAAVEASRGREVRRSLGLDGCRVALFVGAVDITKRMDFLLNAAERIAEEMPRFALIVAGEGPLRGQIDEAASRFDWLVTVGRATGARLAELASISDVIMCPGRVGLIAVDSFALGLPIVTTHWSYHAPEFEYLEHGRNAIITEDNVSSYAAAVRELLCDRVRLEVLAASCRRDADQYAMERTVAAFAEGVNNALAAT